MKTDNGKVKIKAYVVVSLMILLAVSVLAGTVYAVTLDITDAQPVAAGIGSGSVGDGEARPFNWTLDTSQDSNFKPVTNISGKLDGADNSTQNVTTTGYSGSLYDNAVTVTLGGDTSGSSAFYNTNLVYTLKTRVMKPSMRSSGFFRTQSSPLAPLLRKRLNITFPRRRSAMLRTPTACAKH